LPTEGPLEIGLGFYSMQSAYMRPRRHSFLYEEAAAEARLAEELGFDVFWMGEHHHAYDGYCPSLLAAGTYLAAATSRITLATGVLIAPHHRAPRIAEASAAFDSVAPGRLRIAFGIGYWVDEYGASGMDMRTRSRALEEDLGRLLDGDLAARKGATQLWSGQNSPSGIERAAANGLGLLLAEADLPRYQAVRARYAEHWRPRRGQPPRIVDFRDVWVDRDPRRVEWIRGRLLEMWRNYAVNWVDIPGYQGLQWSPDTATRRRQVDELAVKVGASFVAGSPAQVVDALGPLVEAGVDGFAFRVRFDGVGGPDLRRCLESLASEVVPQLQRMAAARPAA
jgi:alkanesulfonate monooxygenase SsuD/methylene tetrahydromethanopterin reductase-like flavin-dependent oxidoreductase (luciferase family)